MYQRQEAKGMGASEGRKRQRAVMATDSDWQTVRERADAAGLDVSRFIVERLTAPVAVPEDGMGTRELAGAVARIERAVAGPLRGREAARGRRRGCGDLGGAGKACRGSRGCRGGARMTADGETGKRSRAHQHTIYCSAADRALIGRRAQEAGMSFSRFMVACALHGGDEDDRGEGPRLVLSEDEQRSLYGRVALLDRCNEALLARLPGTEMSALGALAFLVREARGGAGEGGGDEG